MASIETNILIRSILLISIKIIIILILLIIVGCSVGYFLGYIRLNTELPKQEEEIAKINVEAEVVQDIVSELSVLKNNDATSKERLTYLLEQQEKIEKEGLTPEEEATLRVFVGALQLKNDYVEALQIFTDLYTNRKYEDVAWLEVRVLSDVMIFATEVGSDRLPFDDAKQLIFTPERFGKVVGIKTQDDLANISTVEQAKQLASVGLDVVAKKSGSEIKQLRYRIESDVLKSSGLLNSLYEAGGGDHFTGGFVQEQLLMMPDTTEELQRLREDVDDIYTSTKVQAQLTDIYSADIVYIFNFIQKLYIDFMFTGQDTSNEIETVRKDMLLFMEKHADESEFAKNRSALIKSTSDMFFACSLVIRNNYSIDTGVALEIRENISTILSQPKKSAEEHGAPLAEISKTPHHTCYEPFIQIGNEIEPAFREFLVDDIGGWRYEQFTK